VSHRLARRRSVPSTFTQPEGRCNCRQATQHPGGIFGVDPGHQPPSGIQPRPRVCRSQVCLADTPHPCDRMNHRHTMPPRWHIQLRQQTSSRLETRRLLRDIPDHHRRLLIGGRRSILGLARSLRDLLAPSQQWNEPEHDRSGSAHNTGH
jgi:hypothetical protein